MTVPFLAAALVLGGSTHATPVPVPVVPPARRVARPAASPPARPGDSALFSPRARRLVQTYLRIRLLETREADLERARAVIERRLGIDALLGETPGKGTR